MQTATLILALAILAFGIVQLGRGDAWGALYVILAVILVTRSVRALRVEKASRATARRATYRETSPADADD